MADKLKTNINPFLVFVVAIFYFVAPLETVAIFGQFSLPKLLAIVVIAIRVFSARPFKVSKSLNTFIPLLLYATLSILWSINAGNSIRAVFLFLIPSLLVMEAVDISVNSEKEIRIYLWSFVLGSVFTVVLALINRGQVVSDAVIAGEERLSALGQDKNTYAYLVIMSIAIILFYFRQINQKILKYCLIIVLIASVFVVVSTGSRTGLMVLGLIVMLFVFSNGSITSKIGYVIIIVVSILILLPFIPEATIARFSESSELVREGDFSERGSIWLRAVMCFREENWLLGVGYSNFSEMLAQHYSGWKMASHNTYLTYLIEFGVVGAFTFGIVLYAMISCAIRIYRMERNIFIFSFIFPLFVFMFFLETEYKRWIFMIAVLLFNYEKLIIANKK